MSICSNPIMLIQDSFEGKLNPLQEPSKKQSLINDNSKRITQTFLSYIKPEKK